MSHLIELTRNGFALILGAFLVVAVQVLVHAHDKADLLDAALTACQTGVNEFGDSRSK